MDSCTLLHEYKDNIAIALTFDYGSKQNAQEQRYAIAQCKALGIKHIIIPLNFIKQYFRSALLSDDPKHDIPEGNYNDDNMKSTVVPFRNGIMLSIACGIAESNNLHHVMIANHSGDHAIYPDCRQGFIDAMSLACEQGTYEGITIFAPYTNLTKTDIARRGKALAIDYSMTYSCYRGGDKHCGKCGTCRERKEALHDAGIIDPTPYEE